MLLMLVVGLLLVYVLQKLIIKYFWQNGLSVELKFRDHAIFEGDACVLREVVTNDKRLPLPAVEIRFAMSPHLQFRGEAAQNSHVSDRTTKRDVFSLMMRQQITRNLNFVAKQRGFYQISSTDIKAYDFFYQDLGYRSDGQDTFLYVYPAQVDARRIRTICTAISGSVLVQNRMFPDPFEFCGIREYVPTDPAGRINWKATIRSNVPMVNQYDSTSNLDLAVVFDIEDSHIFKEEELVEETIRIVSSLAAELVRNRMTVSIYGNAQVAMIADIPYDVRYAAEDASVQTESKRGNTSEHTENKLENASGYAEGRALAAEIFQQEISFKAGQITHLNQMLACINGTSMDGVSLLMALAAELGTEQLIVFISKNLTREMIAALTPYASPSHPVLWVVPIHGDNHPTVPEIPYIRVQLWEA